MLTRALALLSVLGLLAGCTGQVAVAPVKRCAKVVDVAYVQSSFLGIVPGPVDAYLVMDDGSRHRDNHPLATADPGYFRSSMIGQDRCRVEFVKK